MTKVDILRILEDLNAQQANEAADARRLSKARLTLRKRLEEIEHGDEDFDS